MPHAEVNGQRLFYEDTGGDGEVIVLSHGLFMDHTMFDAQVEALRGSWRCISWDERGHGQTVSTADPFTYWDAARDLLGLLDHLGVERAVLAGMSQGGYLSLRAALTAPERVRALILIDSQAGTEDPAKLPDYQALIDAWTGPDGAPPEVMDVVGQIVIGPEHAELPVWKERWAAMSPEVVHQVYTTLSSREDDVAPRISELTMPSLVVHGEVDAAVELATGRAFAAALPDAELAVVDGAGHASNLTHPEPVNAAIAAFLDRLQTSN
jgi:pimeloyl-ACP methyl ester carboxylesterase